MDLPVVACCHDIWSVPTMVVIDIIHPLLMRLETEVGNRAAEGPHLDRMVQTSRRERLRIFRIDRQRHDVVCMSLEDLPSHGQTRFADSKSQLT